MDAPEWTSTDLRTWRHRLRWTQVRAAEALCYHVMAYKRLECGTRPIAARVRQLCLLTEREHVRARLSVSDLPGARQVFASAQRVLSRLEALRRDGKLGREGRPGPLRYVSIFSGIEACTAAFERIGADAIPVCFSEIDPAANAILRRRWIDVPRVGDMTEFDWHSLRGQVDLVAGGSPCQPFSVAGRRLGISDPRGNLALHFLRAVDAMRPRWVLFENVPGLLSSDEGRDFEVFCESLEELGYAFCWRILDARHFGVPQRRRRLWVVAESSRSARGPCQVLDLGEGEGRGALSGSQTWKTAPGRIEDRAGELNGDTDAVDWSEAAAWLQEREVISRTIPAGRPATATDPILAFKPTAGAGARTIGASTKDAPTLAAASGGNRAPGLVYAVDMRHATVGDTSMTIQVGPTGWSLNAAPCAIHAVGTEWVVRRMTPLECLRLQGFDDDHLDGATVSGKPLTDSDRFRLVGNSWAVPVAGWILERLLAHIASEQAIPVPS